MERKHPQQGQEKEHHRRSQRKPPSVKEEIGHWVRTAGILVQLIIGDS